MTLLVPPRSWDSKSVADDCNSNSNSNSNSSSGSSSSRRHRHLPRQRGHDGVFRRLSSPSLLQILIGSLVLLPLVAQADIACRQYGSDTFRVGSMVKFWWNDTGSKQLYDLFKLNVYCFENHKVFQTVEEGLNVTTAKPDQNWYVDRSILKFAPDCPMNQYQGGFEYVYLDVDTNQWTRAYTRCKVMLLVGPGVSSAPLPSYPAPPPSSPSDAPPPDTEDDDPAPSQIVVTDRTKHILIGVGSAMGALVLAGVIGFYFIRYKNKRAEEDSMNKKLREPLEQPNGSGSGSARSSGYGNSTFIPQKSEMVQVDDMPLEPVPALVPTSSRRGSTASRPQSFASGARPETPTVSSPLARPSGSFVADRPASVLTSSFIPPPDDRHQRHQQQQQQQQLLHHQQLQQQQQQQHQEHQQQLNNGTYPV